MALDFREGDCVRMPDGRLGRVRDRVDNVVKVRVRRKSGKSHQFLLVAADDLERVECPKGWMRPDAYRRYLRITLAKMRDRERASQPNE